MEDIIKSISSIRSIGDTPSARKTLCTKFQVKGWIDTLAKCSAKQLVQNALVKIEQDSSNFSTFVTMLRDTPGLKIPGIVEKKMRELGELWYMNVGFFH